MTPHYTITFLREFHDGFTAVLVTRANGLSDMWVFSREVLASMNVQRF